MNPIISVKGLTKIFESRKRRPGLLGSITGLVAGEKTLIKAVDSVSFDIGAGELVGYLGPNGAGKSTTIKMLTGILQPTSGDIRIDGLDPTKRRRDVARKIGVVFGQKTQLWWDLPVRESYDLLRMIYRIPKDVFRSRMDYFIDLLGLEDFLDQQTRKLSLGQRMRSDLAASLIHDPSILFLDEPTIGLDILTKDVVRQTIRRLNKEKGITVILTTHDMDDIEFLASRLILLDKGKVQYDGAIDSFINTYQKKKLVTMHLENDMNGVQPSLNGFKLLQAKSNRMFEFEMPKEESVAPLIEWFNNHGGRIQEINVRKEDLTDTLKGIYAGQKLEL
ncbi:MAG: ATP-binding cassette domain-containing protein [Leptonema illini]|uniref:ABC transporter related protein n=2 Tax=Leptonema illini TaxID=183 RepID=H2CHS3_9LEPT|nr:ATP-binding cassette domain-containing protein [Leptonema illini]EHQ05918.1 ABC transporter related protein [Leptonema illini DSM 21528]KAB2932367.1 MAG: ATP-binding cassette domain-containing protein [Leptonema illini]